MEAGAVWERKEEGEGLKRENSFQGSYLQRFKDLIKGSIS